jgi:lysophospholipase L1-like esterase
MPLRLDLDVASMADDGFHPGPAVYAAWAEQLGETIGALDISPRPGPMG